MMELATNKIKDNSMLKSTADIQANKHQVKLAVMKLDDLDGPRSTSFSWLDLMEWRGGHSIVPVYNTWDVTIKTRII